MIKCFFLANLSFNLNRLEKTSTGNDVSEYNIRL